MLINQEEEGMGDGWRRRANSTVSATLLVLLMKRKTPSNDPAKGSEWYGSNGEHGVR
jgi:hypothetical protein